MKINILCPSRIRPDRFNAMAESAQSLAADKSRVHIHLGLDDDDPRFEEYLYGMPHGVTVHVNDQKRSCPALLEWLAGEARGDILLVGSDDILFRTPRWDDLLEAEYRSVPDGLLAVAFNDLSGRTKWTHFAVGREWYRLVGHLTYAGFEHFGADEYVERIATLAGRGRWLKHIVLEHMHKKYRNPDGTPKGPNDASYDAKRQKAVDGSSMSSRDVVRLQKLVPQMAMLAERIRNAARSPGLQPLAADG